MTMALIIAVAWNGDRLLSLGIKIALMSSGAQPVTREQLPRLYEVMERLAAKANPGRALSFLHCSRSGSQRVRHRPEFPAMLP